jgi:hypothetical protein
MSLRSSSPSRTEITQRSLRWLLWMHVAAGVGLGAVVSSSEGLAQQSGAPQPSAVRPAGPQDRIQPWTQNLRYWQYDWH